MTPAFLHAIEIVLAHEGGHVDHPRDPGGVTKYGISKRAHPKVDVDNLTRDGAVEIYWSDYWEPWEIESLPAELRVKVFDMTVNMGGRQAYKLLQRVMNRFGAELDVDGLPGPLTLGSLRGLARQAPGGLERIVHELRNEQADYYMTLVHRSPELGVFIDGWLRRAYA